MRTETLESPCLGEHRDETSLVIQAILPEKPKLEATDGNPAKQGLHKEKQKTLTVLLHSPTAPREGHKPPVLQVGVGIPKHPSQQTSNEQTLEKKKKVVLKCVNLVRITISGPGAMA